MNSDNPYAAPTTVETYPVGQKPETKTLGAIAKETFLAWEKMRLIFIGLLVFITIAFTLMAEENLWIKPDFWEMLIVGAIFVNVCYFAGPIVETYATWLWGFPRWLRWVLFGMGTVVAKTLTIAALATDLLPDQM